MTPRFTEDEVRSILEATSGDFAGASLADHAKGAFEALQRAIPHSSLNVFLLRDGVPAPVYAQGLIDERGLLDYVGHYIQFDPMKETFGKLSSTAATLVECARSKGVDLRENEFLQDYALPRYRIGDLLGSNTLIGEDAIFTFALHRDPGLGTFSERDQAALRLALGPLSRALRVTYARERALEVLRGAATGETAPPAEPTGVAVLDEHLDVVEISPVARVVLQDLERTGALDELLGVAASLVERLEKTPGATTFEGSLVRRLGARAASMKVVATRSALQAKVAVYIFIELVASPTQPLISRIAPRFGLTDREVEITTLLHEGFTLTTIAKRLRLQPQTVRATLLGIRKKLGVRTNEQILLRLLTGP